MSHGVAELHATVGTWADHCKLRLSIRLLFLLWMRPWLSRTLAILSVGTNSNLVSHLKWRQIFTFFCHYSSWKCSGEVWGLWQLEQGPLLAVVRDVFLWVGIIVRVRRLICHCSGDTSISWKGVLRYLSSPLNGSFVVCCSLLQDTFCSLYCPLSCTVRLRIL